MHDHGRHGRQHARRWAAGFILLLTGSQLALAQQSPPVVTFGTPTPSVYLGGSAPIDPLIDISLPEGTSFPSVLFTGPDLTIYGTPSIVLDNDVCGVQYDRLLHGYVLTNPSGSCNSWSVVLAAMRKVRFHMPGGAPGTYELTIWLQHYPDYSISVTRAINLLPIAFTTPSPVNTAVDQPITFSDPLRIRYTPNLYNDPQYVGLQVSHGRITVINTTGISFSYYPNGSASPLFEGVWSNLDAALDGFVYTPDAGYQGPDQLIISVGGIKVGGSGPMYAPVGSTTLAIQVGGTPVELQSFEVQ